MVAGDRRLWSAEEETRLLIWSLARKSLADFARANGRSATCVRVKLHRLRNTPALRPPEFTQSRDAAVPRVPMARGPVDTSDSN